MKDLGISIVFICIFAIDWGLGLYAGLTTTWKLNDPIVINEIHKVNSENGCYKYITNKFDFYSDSTYVIGDTIKLVKYVNK